MRITNLAKLLLSPSGTKYNNIGPPSPMSYIALLFPILVFCTVTWKYCVDIPWFDDFDPFPISLDIFLKADSLWDKLAEVFRPNNEHRMIFGKISMLVYYFFSGKLNFRFLQATGIAFSVGTFFVIYRAFIHSKMPLWYLIPVPFFLFQFEHYSIYGWSICGLQHSPSIFFITLTSYLLARERFYWAIAAAICTNFAMSNGILVWAVGGSILLLQHQYKKTLFWGLLGAFMIFLYFNGLTTMGNESSFPYIKANPLSPVSSFLTFIGGIFDLLPDRPIHFRIVLPIIFGFIGTICILIWWLKLLKRWTIPQVFVLFLVGISVFTILNAGLIGVLRSRHGLAVMLISNYKPYPALFAAVVYLVVLHLLTNKNQFRAFLGFSLLSVLLWAFTYVHYTKIFVERSKSLIVHAYNQKNNGFGLGFIAKSNEANFVNKLMTDLAAKKIYDYPDTFNPVVEAIKNRTVQATKLTPMVENDSKVLEVNLPYYPYKSGFDNGIYLFLQSEDKLYVFKMNPRPNMGKNVFRTYDSGANIRIDKAEYKPVSGNYKMGFVEVKKGDIEVTDYQEVRI